MITRILTALFLCCSFLSGLTTANEPVGERLVLLCSTTQIADFARQVVGDQCEVKCILAPGADPHTYTPVPGDASMAAAADLCLQNGLHLEGKNWMATLAKDAGKPIVTCTDGIKPLEMDYDGTLVNDPHSWFTPKNASVYVSNITRAICGLDPDHADQYQARAKLYLQQLRAVDGWIREQFSAIPVDKRILVTSHDAFNYFCGEYGFKARSPVGWSTGSEMGGGMTPKRRKQVVDSIKSFGVKSVFIETSVNPKLIREIAREAGVRVGGELYSDSMGDQGSAGETYIGMMRENVLTIVGALK
jgi:manganese/iron transport system substrate-binding protein